MSTEPASLHPLLAHHVLNTLGWPSLRPLQKRALGPIQSGEHVVIVAPTAGGKTEAAVFPVLSRMLEEDWPALSVLYLCPLRALLNNLHPRLERYATLVGRKVGLWHGDVDEGSREAIRSEPPDLLLTTPESIEAMLISGKTDHRRLFRNVRAVIVDEIHAFADDDRGWHLLAVTERVRRIAGRDLQRVGLSATVGNPAEILAWLTTTSSAPGRVIAPEISAPSVPAPDGSARPGISEPDVTVDYVGDLDNAATVISRLHRGQKRLVFVDSRARVEQLAAALRDRGVETYLSHGSLGREERRAAEQAFANSRNCVIVATSTLELGIDVGDLDRVIQIDAPPAVASFLQRLGRTGRRAGTASNTLFLATREDAFLQSLGLLRAWEDGYVEPLEPPPLPLHLLVQQLLALVLQERGVGSRTWPDWYGEPFVLGDEVAAFADALTGSLLDADFLFEDNGILGIGQRGLETFGHRHFMELMAVFSEPPNFKVLAGRQEIGQIPMRLLMLVGSGDHLLLLAGRDWAVLDVDWRRGVVQVEPGDRRGKVRWFGDGRGLSFTVCQGIRSVLAGRDLARCRLSGRARTQLERAREEFWWATERAETVLVEAEGERSWWTFAGMTVNAWLAAGVGDMCQEVVPGDLCMRIRSDVDPADFADRVAAIDPAGLQLGERVAQGAVDRLKFAEALPEAFARQVVERRMRADEAVRLVAGWEVRGVG